jgi:hypothetical protein
VVLTSRLNRRQKFGRPKYHRRHLVNDQLVFGGVEQESGRTFLVPVLDRTVDTLTSVISAWIEPSTKPISDCWAAYLDIGSVRYTQHTINNSISFVNPDTGDHTNTIQSTWRYVKAFLGLYYRRKDYEFYLVHYMFVAKCKSQAVPQVTKFLAIVASTDCDTCTTHAASVSGVT